MMVGRLLSYWEGIFSGAMLNFQGVDLPVDFSGSLTCAKWHSLNSFWCFGGWSRNWGWSSFHIGDGHPNPGNMGLYKPLLLLGWWVYHRLNREFPPHFFDQAQLEIGAFCCCWSFINFSCKSWFFVGFVGFLWIQKWWMLQEERNKRKSDLQIGDKKVTSWYPKQPF